MLLSFCVQPELACSKYQTTINSWSRHINILVHIQVACDDVMCGFVADVRGKKRDVASWEIVQQPCLRYEMTC